MSEKFAKLKKALFMPAIAEARFLTRQIAEPRPVGDSVKAAVARAYERLLIAADRLRKVEKIDVADLSHNRVKDFWQGSSRARPRRDELTILEAAIKTVGQPQQRLERVGRDELGELRTRMDRIERLLAAAYSDSGSVGAAAVRQSRVGADRAAGARHSSLAGPGERS